MAQEATAGPLSGVRVLELSVAIAGPATAGILSDWSALSPATPASTPTITSTSSTTTQSLSKPRGWGCTSARTSSPS